MGYVLNKYRKVLMDKEVAAIIFIADAMGEKSWSQVVPAMSRGTYDVEGGSKRNRYYNTARIMAACE